MQLILGDREVDLNEHLPQHLQDCLGRALEHIHKYDTEDEWAKEGITKNDKYLRYMFWRVLDKAIFERKKVAVKTIYGGVCTKQAFYAMLKSPARCGYFFSKPISHDLESVVLLDRAKTEMLSVLDLPNTNEKGWVLPAVVNAKVKVYAMLMDRVHGQTIQRIEQKTVTKNIKDEKNKTKNVKELEAELALIEKESKGEVIDVG